jgi:hypothetical protein
LIQRSSDDFVGYPLLDESVERRPTLKRKRFIQSEDNRIERKTKVKGKHESEICRNSQTKAKVIKRIMITAKVVGQVQTRRRNCKVRANVVSIGERQFHNLNRRSTFAHHVRQSSHPKVHNQRRPLMTSLIAYFRFVIFCLHEKRAGDKFKAITKKSERLFCCDLRL